MTILSLLVLCVAPSTLIIVAALIILAIVGAVVQSAKPSPREQMRYEAHQSRMEKDRLARQLMLARLYNAELDTDTKRANLAAKHDRLVLNEFKIDEERKNHPPQQDFKARNYPDP